MLPTSPRSSAIWVLGFERVGAIQAGSGREKQNKLNLALEWQMNEVHAVDQRHLTFSEGKEDWGNC